MLPGRVVAVIESRVGISKMRAQGITQREIDLMYKINPAKLLGLPPPEVAALNK